MQHVYLSMLWVTWSGVESNVLVVALAVLAFGLLAGRLRSRPVTMPTVFTGAGSCSGPACSAS
jgi:hypothetical protein